VKRPPGVLLDVRGVLLLPGHDAVRRALLPIAFEPDDSLIDRAEYHAIGGADEAPQREDA